MQKLIPEIKFKNKTTQRTFMENKTIIKSELIVDQLYDDIKRRIIEGELAPDTRLNTRDLCIYYKVSDTPLKQALNRLVSENLVSAFPRRGMWVRAFSEKDIHEAIEARIIIELFAVKPALSEAINGNLLKKLSENIAEDKKSIAKIKTFKTYSAEVQREQAISQEFHILFVNSLHNETIMRMYKNIINHRHLYSQFGKDKTAEATASLREHEEILRCLKSGDEDKLKEAIIAHLRTREYDVNVATKKS